MKRRINSPQLGPYHLFNPGDAPATQCSSHIIAFIISKVIDTTMFLLNLSGFSHLPLHLLVSNLAYTYMASLHAQNHSLPKSRSSAAHSHRSLFATRVFQTSPLFKYFRFHYYQFLHWYSSLRVDSDRMRCVYSLRIIASKITHA